MYDVYISQTVDRTVNILRNKMPLNKLMLTLAVCTR